MLEWNTLSLVVLHENLSDEKGMSCIGFLKPTILVPVFSAESTVLSFYAGFKVEKPHYANFFTDLLRLGRPSLSAPAHRDDLRRLGGGAPDEQELGTSGAETVVGHRLCHQHRPVVYL